MEKTKNILLIYLEKILLFSWKIVFFELDFKVNHRVVANIRFVDNAHTKVVTLGLLVFSITGYWLVVVEKKSKKVAMLINFV